MEEGSTNTILLCTLIILCVTISWYNVRNLLRVSGLKRRDAIPENRKRFLCVFRPTMFIYFVGVIGKNVSDTSTYDWIYLTNVTYVLQGFHFFVGSILHTKDNQAICELHRILFIICFNMAFLIMLVYFGLLCPRNGDCWTFYSINAHFLNFLALLLEHCLTDITFENCLCLFSLNYTLIYSIILNCRYSLGYKDFPYFYMDLNDSVWLWYTFIAFIHVPIYFFLGCLKSIRTMFVNADRYLVLPQSGI
jgi:hypothetical protein